MDTTEGAARSAQVAAVFDRVAETYDNVGVPWFTPIAQGLVRLAAPAPGERVLDVGCGRGAALLPAAEAAGDSGHVTGIDLSARMIAACRAEVEARGLTNVDLVVTDASAPSLPAGGYDLVVSSLVVFFLPDPLGALTAWRRLLAPGGRLAMTTFAQRDSVWEDVDATFRPYLPARMLDARTSGAAGPFGSDAGVEELVAAAGYAGVRTSSFDTGIDLAGADEWYTFSRSHGQRAMWDAIPEADQDKVRAQAGDLLERARGADGRIHLHQRIRCTLATA
jgi:ubiquinone/menaquinone biosynthesis C-methylase UbiE